MARSCPPGSCRRVLDLVDSGRKVAEVAEPLDISERTVDVWRGQQLIGTG
ncbi:hypothetical protein [Streptomyces sp. NPDC006997]